MPAIVVFPGVPVQGAVLFVPPVGALVPPVGALDLAVLPVVESIPGEGGKELPLRCATLTILGGCRPVLPERAQCLIQ